MLKQFEIPSNAAALVRAIEANTDSLLPIISVDDDLAPAIWSCPEPREQSEWNQVCPAGGRLLHSQGCILAMGLASEEWLMGRMFISDRGVGIQGSSGAFLGSFEVALWTGLLMWPTIEAMERDESIIILEIKKGTFRDTVIKLQLSSEAEFDRLRQAWDHYVVSTPDKFCSFHSASTAARHSASMIAQEEGHAASTPSSNHIKADAPFTQSFVQATNALPERMEYNKPLVTNRIPGVSIEAVRRVLEQDDDWFMCRFQVAALQAFDIRATPWTPGQVVPGTTVRRLNFKLPKPDDIPKAVANVIGFPDVLISTLAARLQRDEDGTLTLHMHSCAFNAPYGDHQRLEDVLVFRPDGEGGVSVSKFMKVVWVKRPPMHLSMVKGVLESKVKSDGCSTFAMFCEMVGHEALKLSSVA